MVEGAILLPFFIIVFAGVIYSHQSLSARLGAAVKARECGWQHANSGCDPDRLPDGCTFEDATHAQLGAMEDVEGADRSQFQQGVSQVADGMGNFVETFLRLGDGTTATASRELRRPAVLGGGQTRVSARYAVLCNEKKQEPIDVIKAAWCALKAPGCG